MEGDGPRCGEEIEAGVACGDLVGGVAADDLGLEGAVDVDAEAGLALVQVAQTSVVPTSPTWRSGRRPGPGRGRAEAFDRLPRVWVGATAHLEDRPWGTSIDLHVAGLRAGSLNSVWLEDATGRQTPAGTFRGVANRTLNVRLATATSRSASVAIGVSDAQGATLLRAPLPE